MGQVEALMRKAADFLYTKKATCCCHAISFAAETHDEEKAGDNFFQDLFLERPVVATGLGFIITDGTAPEEEARDDIFWMQTAAEYSEHGWPGNVTDNEDIHGRRIMALLFAAEVAHQEGV